MLTTASRSTTTPNSLSNNRNSNDDSRLPFRTTTTTMSSSSPATNKKPTATHRSGGPTLVSKPSKYDVLLGNSKEARLHFGTEYLNTLIVETYHEYHVADRATDYLDREKGKKSKQDINKEIYQLIGSKGGRFLQKSKKKTGSSAAAGWEEIDIQRAINRISSSFGHKHIAERVKIRDAEKEKEKKLAQQQQQQPEQQEQRGEAVGGAAVAARVASSSNGGVSLNGADGVKAGAPPTSRSIEASSRSIEGSSRSASTSRSIEAPTVPSSAAAHAASSSTGTATTPHRRRSSGGAFSGVSKLMHKVVKRARSREFGPLSSSASRTNSSSSMGGGGQAHNLNNNNNNDTSLSSSSQRSRQRHLEEEPRNNIGRRPPPSSVVEQKRSFPDFDSSKPNEYVLALPTNDDDSTSSSDSDKEYDHDEVLASFRSMRQQSFQSLARQEQSFSFHDSSQLLDRAPLRMESESSVLMNQELAEQLLGTKNNNNNGTAASTMEPVRIGGATSMNNNNNGTTSGAPQRSNNNKGGLSTFAKKALLFKQRGQQQQDQRSPPTTTSAFGSQSDPGLTFEYDSAKFMRTANLSANLMDTFDSRESVVDGDDDFTKRNRSTDTVLSTEPARRRPRQGASVDVMPAATTSSTGQRQSLLSIAGIASAKKLASDERRRRKTSQEKILMMRQKRSGQCKGGEETPASSQRALRLAQNIGTTGYQPQLEESSSFANRLTEGLKQHHRILQQQQQAQQAGAGGGLPVSPTNQQTSHTSSSMGTIAADFSNLSMDTVHSLSSDEEDDNDTNNKSSNNNDTNNNSNDNLLLLDDQEQLQSSNRNDWSMQSSSIFGGSVVGGELMGESEPVPVRGVGVTRTSAGVLGSWLDEFDEEDEVAGGGGGSDDVYNNSNGDLLSKLHDSEEVERDVREMMTQLGRMDHL